MVPVYAWRPNPITTNFGDELGWIISQCILGRQITVTSDGLQPGKLIAGGSTMTSDHLQKGDVVWGAGAREDNPPDYLSCVDFRAVRGPLTRDKLGCRKNIPLGDPGLLIPRFFPQPPKTDRLGIVRHFRDTQPISDYEISPTLDPIHVVREIASCALIASSSLHGIIIAEAYGIDAILLDSEELRRQTFKYRDYYASTGRELPTPTPYDQLSKAAIPPKPKMPNLDRLLASFPSKLDFGSAGTVAALS